MRDIKSADLLRLAADCRAAASQSTNDTVATQFLALASGWDEMAARAKKFEAELALLASAVTSAGKRSKPE
jgi:hypothetical protein